MKHGPGNYAGFVSRSIAFGIDFVIVLLVCTAGVQFVRAVGSALGVDRFAEGQGGALAFGLSVPVVLVVYCAVLWTLVGRTIGMMALGLRVVTVDGTKLGVGRSFVRAVGYWLSMIFLIGFIWMVFDQRRQGLHDKLAHTFVVYDFARDDAGVSPSSTAAATR
jgi:uncharacterized RDD family membrane protein YckC